MSPEKILVIWFQIIMLFHNSYQLEIPKRVWGGGGGGEGKGREGTAGKLGKKGKQN